MLKHLSWIPWIMALLTAGIIICLSLITHALLSQPPQAAAYPEAVLVMEKIFHALA